MNSLRLSTVVRHLRLLFAIVTIFMLSAILHPEQADAQPSLNFKRLINNWPTIELYFQVACDGDPAYVFNRQQNFKVYENGVEVGEFTLWCPDPRQRCAISVSLVFDASLSMRGAPNAGAIQAGNAFVDLMDGWLDEANVIWFTTPVLVRLGMTINTTALHDAIDELPANQCCSACWDGIYIGIQELANTGNNPCRAVIIVTDGRDNASTRTVQEVVAFANRNRVRVFTIGLGNVNYAELESIAILTGGRFYQVPTPNQLVAIYEEISTIILGGFQECLITYEAECEDGGVRTVDLSLLNFCNGSDTKTKTYRAPLDTTTHVPIEIRLGEREGKGNASVGVPLELVTPIIPKNFIESATFTVLFDPSCMQFEKIETPPGTLLAGTPIDVEPIPGGVAITTTQRVPVEGVGTFAELFFKLADADDTTCCELDLATWVFDAGCFKPLLVDGEICIVPRVPEVTCSLEAVRDLAWVRSLKDYSPNPFSVKARVFNVGDKTAMATSFKIEYDPKDFYLVSPITDTQPGTPIDVDVGEFSEAAWLVHAKPRMTGDSVEICISASFSNHHQVTCCHKVWIPPTEPILDCSITAPAIVANNTLQRYDPMPFELVVDVLNRGGMKSDTVFATIWIGPDLELADPKEPQTKIITPALLLPNQQGGVRWNLRHPITLTQKEYYVRVTVNSSNTDSSSCEYQVIIPPLEAPSIQATCNVPVRLTYNENLDEYVVNPFTVTLQAANMGSMPAHDVSAFLWLPEYVVLEPPTQSLRHQFGTMDKWSQGDPLHEATWTVRYTKKLRYNTMLDFKWSIAGVGPTNIATDTVTAFCSVDVPGLKPSFKCELFLPDSLALNAAGTNVEPNPFDVKYKIWNDSKQVASIDYVEVFFPNEGIALAAASPPKRQMINVTLSPGDTTEVSWIFQVTNRIVRRQLRIQAAAVDDEGNPIICQKDLPIAALKTALTCNLEADPVLLRYDQLEQKYTDSTITLTATLVNAGGFNLSDIEAEVSIISDPENLIEYESGINPWTYPVLFKGETVTMSWDFKLKQPNLTGISQYVEFSVAYQSTETPRIENTCNTFAEVQPKLAPKLICTLKSDVDSIMFGDNAYVPENFKLEVRVRNIGDGEARNVRAYVEKHDRFTISPQSAPGISIGSIPPYELIDFGDNDGFELAVNPRPVDRWDTLYVMVVADGIPEARCTLPIFVEAERRPKFSLQCMYDETSPLIFDPSIDEYTPNPFKVRTVIMNTGDQTARECKITFVGPKHFSPFGQASVRDLGEIIPGAIVDLTWYMQALRQEKAVSEELHFEITGKGGIENDLVIAECQVPVDIPPARSADYKLTCSSPAALLYDKNTGTYDPDPFVFTVTVKNSGIADGHELNVRPLWTGGVTLAALETEVKTIPLLKIGDEVTLTWFMNAIATSVPDTVLICAEVRDKFNRTAECCSRTFVPPATIPTFDLVCSSQFDTLRVDQQIGDYAVNPFAMYLSITNSGDRPVDSVYVSVYPKSRDLLLVRNPDGNSATSILIAARLAPGESIHVDRTEWSFQAQSDEQGREAFVQFVVRAKGLPARECITSVYLPPVGTPVLDCTISSIIEDDAVLNFDYEIGDYEGVLSSNNQYTVFPLKVFVHNRGEAMAKGVYATIILSNEVQKEEGEASRKEVIPFDIPAGVGHGSVEWNLRVIRQRDDTPAWARIHISSENAELATCSFDFTIEGAPKLVTVTLPEGIVGQYKDKIAVPVQISPTIGRDVKVYKLNVRYRSTVLHFIGATNENTQTEHGWNGPQAEIFDAGSGYDVVRIEDLTTGSPLASKTEGVLVYLLFEAVFGGEDASKMSYAHSPLEMDDVQRFSLGGNDYRSSMNSYEDEEHGDVTLSYRDGLVTVSGECIVPLNSSLQFQLAQNKPNPFNPATVIEYTVGFDSPVKLEVFDALGRHVRTLVDEFQKSGNYRVTFDASGLPSGIYLYKLETPRYTEMKRMVLTR